jgi:hypothetical protein
MIHLNLSVEDFPNEFDWYNDQFPPLDALTYWHLLKEAKKVIEVGCGYSSILSYKANVELIPIDPNPRIMYPNISYIKEEVQKMPLSMFQELNEGDILFIDSSHIYKEGSDVHFLIHEVIPTLKDGVLIHFHDYFGLDGYPSDWQQHHEMKHWNENDKIIELEEEYNVIVCNHYISNKFQKELKEKYSFVPTDITQNLGAVKGASIWFKILPF